MTDEEMKSEECGREEETACAREMVTAESGQPETQPAAARQTAAGEDRAEQPQPEPCEEKPAEQAQVEVAAADAAAAYEPEAEDIVIPVESVNYEEFVNRLNGYYENLARLIRIAKAKDDTIAKLSREVQAYREDFSLKLVKPFCADIIALREDYRKTMREIDKYVKTPQDAVKYSGYVKSELEDVLMNRGIELEGDRFVLNGEPLAYMKPRTAKFVAPEQVEANVPKAEEYVAGKPSFDELLRFIAYKNSALEALLAESAVADANLAAYEKAVAALDDNYSDSVLLPLYKATAALYSRVDGLCEEITQTVTEDNKVGKYNSVLQLALEGIYQLLSVAGVEVVSEVSDALDSAKDKILKVVPCEDPALDRKVAKRYTDCYLFNGKVLYPSKVDVYKYGK